MIIRKANRLINVALVALATCSWQVAHAQYSGADLDRDGIPNINDRDVDNDGIPNGADRNIDGGICLSGPLMGRAIGDNLPNHSLREFDMDADGLADGAANEMDIDGDGLMDGSARERDIDGDGLADHAANETDTDGDGLADNAASEMDIDGDGLMDNQIGEYDIDGDGVANGLDGDIDGDSMANTSDADLDGTGVNDDIFSGADAAYAEDASVASTIAYVSAEVREVLQIPATDAGLRVRVSASPAGDLVSGVWRYLSNDHIQVYAKWCYPAEDPSRLKIFVVYEYTGPYTGNPSDYTNPANYKVSEENRLYAQFPRGPFTFVSWLPSEPANFFYTAPNQQATGFPPPFEPLKAALGSLPDFECSEPYLSFPGDFTDAAGFPGLQPIVDLQRTIMQVNRTWYGPLEAQMLR